MIGTEEIDVINGGSDGVGELSPAFSSQWIFGVVAVYLF